MPIKLLFFFIKNTIFLLEKKITNKKKKSGFVKTCDEYVHKKIAVRKSRVQVGQFVGERIDIDRMNKFDAFPQQIRFTNQ